MSAIDDITGAIAQISQSISEAATATAAAIEQANEGVTAAEAVGVESGIAAMTAMKETLESLSNQVAGLSQAVEEAESQAGAMADGT